MAEHKNNKGSVFVPESAYKSQSTQFGLVIIVVSAIRIGSMKRYPACLSIVRFSGFPTLQTEKSCWAKLFFAHHNRFFPSRTSMCYHFCSRIWSGCGRLEARGQVRARPHTLSILWHGIVFTLWRYEKIRQKMLSWKVEKCLEKKTSRSQIFRHYIQKLEQNSKRRLIWKNSEKGPVVWKRYGIIPSKMFDGGWGARNHATVATMLYLKVNSILISGARKHFLKLFQLVDVRMTWTILGLFKHGQTWTLCPFGWNLQNYIQCFWVRMQVLLK